MNKHIFFIKGFCTCLDCDFVCEKKSEMIAHCKSKKHNGEITLTESINYED